VLPDVEEAHVLLAPGLPLRFALLEGKHLREEDFRGTMVKLSARGGHVLSQHRIAALSNLRMIVLGEDEIAVAGEFYAKVMGPLPAGREGFAVRFTSLPPEVAQMFARLTRAEQE
jgi:adenylate cyclase